MASRTPRPSNGSEVDHCWKLLRFGGFWCRFRAIRSIPSSIEVATGFVPLQTLRKPETLLLCITSGPPGPPVLRMTRKWIFMELWLYSGTKWSHSKPSAAIKAASGRRALPNSAFFQLGHFVSQFGNEVSTSRSVQRIWERLGAALGPKWL